MSTVWLQEMRPSPARQHVNDRVAANTVFESKVADGAIVGTASCSDGKNIGSRQLGSWAGLALDVWVTLGVEDAPAVCPTCEPSLGHTILHVLNVRTEPEVIQADTSPVGDVSRWVVDIARVADRAVSRGRSEGQFPSVPMGIDGSAWADNEAAIPIPAQGCGPKPTRVCLENMMPETLLWSNSRLRRRDTLAATVNLISRLEAATVHQELRPTGGASVEDFRARMGLHLESPIQIRGATPGDACNIAQALACPIIAHSSYQGVGN